MSGQVTQVVRKYPELASDSEGRSLQTELDMFLTLPAVKNGSPYLGTCSQALRNVDPTMRAMFPHVEALIRLLIVVYPASSATAELSFSSLR